MAQGFTSEWLFRRQAEATLSKRDDNVTSNATECERGLHVRIQEECKARGWVMVHSRMDMKTTIGVGVCDFIIFAQGLTFCIECKSRAGKLSVAQLAFMAAMARNGHMVHVIRSFQDFLEIVPRGGAN